MIIDFHTHVGQNKFVSSTTKDLQQEMQKNNITHSVCFMLGNNVKENSLILAQESPTNIIPFFRFDPKNTTAEELNLCLPKFKGVKLHPRLENFDPLDPTFDKLFKIIEEHHLPIIIHTRKENDANTDPDRLITLVERYPKITFIFGHFANGVDSVFAKLKDLPNLYIETSIVSSPAIIEMTVTKYGSTKILFGSDYPYSDQELELQKILRAKISQEDKDNILYKNAIQILEKNCFKNQG